MLEAISTIILIAAVGVYLKLNGGVVGTVSKEE